MAGIVGFSVCTATGQQAEHRFHTVAPFQSAGGAAVCVFGNLFVVLPIGGQPHNIVPLHILEFRKMVPVKTGIVSIDGLDIVPGKPMLQIRNGIGPGADYGLYRCFDEQGIVVHTAGLALDGQNVIFGFDGSEGIRIRNDGADAHNLICPVGFGVDNGKSAHLFLSFVLIFLMRKGFI